MIVHQGHMIIIILYLLLQDQPTFFHKSGTAGLLCDPDEGRGGRTEIHGASIMVSKLNCDCYITHGCAT